MDLLKLLPLLFVAAQGDARAIHQQLLPAIPGYVPVYIQQGPDVQVIYETGRKAAIVEEVPAAMTPEQEEVMPDKEAMPQKAAQEVLPPKSAEEVLPTVASSEEPKDVLPPKEETSVLQPENSKGDSMAVEKTDVEDKKDAVEQNSIRREGSKRMVGSGSVYLVPGYHTDDK